MIDTPHFCIYICMYQIRRLVLYLNMSQVPLRIDMTIHVIGDKMLILTLNFN